MDLVRIRFIAHASIKGEQVIKKRSNNLVYFFDSNLLDLTVRLFFARKTRKLKSFSKNRGWILVVFVVFLASVKENS